MYYFLEGFCLHRNDLDGAGVESLSLLLNAIAVSGAVPCSLLSLKIEDCGSTETDGNPHENGRKRVGNGTKEQSLTKSVAAAISIDDLRALILDEVEAHSERENNVELVQEAIGGVRPSIDSHEELNSYLEGNEDENHLEYVESNYLYSTSTSDFSSTDPSVPTKPRTSPLSVANSISCPQSKSQASGKLFFQCINFWTKIVDVSRSLVKVKRSDRNKILHNMLYEVSGEFLPSSTICAPVSNVCHRIWDIHPSESFVFNTKDRVPFLVCLEVLDYDRSQIDAVRNVIINPQSSGDIDAGHLLGEILHFTALATQQHERSKDLLESVEPANKCLHFIKESSDNRRYDLSSFHTEEAMSLTHGNSYNAFASKLSTSCDRDRTEASPFFNEYWSAKEERVKFSSPVGHLPGWRLVPVIVKSDDDLRQEQFASYVIKQMYEVLEQSFVDCWLRPYDVIALSPDSGLIEVIPDSISLDSIHSKLTEMRSHKKTEKSCEISGIMRGRSDNAANDDSDLESGSSVNYIKLFFERQFGGSSSKKFEEAKLNFMKSLAGYSVVCYLLQLKDRHNGNILIDAEGHLVHIDFGFILGKTPGGNMGFESAPFKLTSDFVDLMGGMNSSLFRQYRDTCVASFLALRQQSHRITLSLEMLIQGAEHLPCFFGDPQKSLFDMKKRFQLHLSDREATKFMNKLIDESAGDWTSSMYDCYQKCCVGIY